MLHICLALNHAWVDIPLPQKKLTVSALKIFKKVKKSSEF